MQNKVREIATLANPLSFMSRVFNIAPSQWARVAECWFITFFFKVGAAIGATILTAAFLARFGIMYLPVLFIVSALLIIASTMLFEQLIMQIKREVLMMTMLFAASLLLFGATYFYESSPYVFFGLTIAAESIFLAQFNIFVPILVGDRFTPLESQSTFPFIESGETIGGIAGGALLALFGAKLPVTWFMYIWIALLICAMVVFIVTSFIRTSLPTLPHTAGHVLEKKPSQVKMVMRAVKQMPFLKSLVIIVLMQWVFMNFLDFQFTKSVEQSVVKSPEATVVQVDDTNHLFQASLITNGVDTPENNAEKTHAIERKLSHEQEAQLSGELGKIRGSFHTAALIVQALIATRLIASLGVVGSMLLHPIIMLMSLVGMFLRFGLISSTITRMNFEITNVVYKNAYFTSHYALPKSIRDQSAQFLEGIARPLGTVLGMSAILGIQFFATGKDVSMSIHIMMGVIMFAVFVATLRLQSKYTDITKEQLFSKLPYPEKLNAIEILAQHGHKDAPSILVSKLAHPDSYEENSIVRVKLLSALGQYSDYRTLPEILDALSDRDPDVRLQAAHALMHFKDIGNKFYSQSFSRYRMMQVLKETFKKEKYQAVRSAIIRVFSILRQAEIIPFLLEQLQDPNPGTRADCIMTLGSFKDPNAAFYILPLLDDADLKVQSSAMVALWQFPKYRDMLEERLARMLASTDHQELYAALYVMGEVQHDLHRSLLKYVQSDNHPLALEAAFALTKCGVPEGFMYVLAYLLSLPLDEFHSIRLFLDRLVPTSREMVERVIVHLVSHEINQLMHLKNISSVEDIDTKTLEKLRRYYTIIGQHEELYEFENALARRLSEAHV